MLLWLLLPLGALLGLLIGLAALSAGTKPAVGLEQGCLRVPPASTKNSVCSEAGSPAGAAVGPLAFSGAPDVAWERARRAVIAQGGHIEQESPGYLWATYRTRIFRFVDDLELRLDREHNVIQVRSAARVGHSDLGANRRRVEELRRRFSRG